MKQKINNSIKRKSKGLTLIELVVVLAILVILGGLVAPLVTKLVKRAFSAAETSIIPELATTIRTRIAATGTLGDKLDNLISEDDLYDKLPHLAIGGSDLDVLTTIALPDADTALQFAKIGLQEVVPGDNTYSDATKGFDGATALTAIASGLNVAALNNDENGPIVQDRSGAAVQLKTGRLVTHFGGGADFLANNPKVVKQLVGGVIDYEYYVFGIGGQSTLVGSVLDQAPVHATDDETGDSRNYYQRYCVVLFPYAVYDMRDARNKANIGDGRKRHKCEFVGVFAMNMDGIVTVSSAQDDFAEATDQF